MGAPVWYTAYRNFLKAQGLCVHCGKSKAMGGWVVCGFCNEEMNERNVGYYNRNKANGMCVRHGSIKAVPGKTSCTACLLRDRIRGHERRTKKCSTLELS